MILFKEGTKSDLNNYRGITLLSMLVKLPVDISKNQLWKVVDKHEILTENQAGLRKGYRTTDHLFILTTIIDHYVIKNKNLYFYVLLTSERHLIKLTTNYYGRKS